MTASVKEVTVVPMQTVSLPADLNALNEINALLSHMLSGPYEEILFKTQLVVEELLANICSYAYEGRAGTAEFACGVVNFDGQEAVMIQLTDSGRPYDPFAHAVEPDLQAPLEDRPIGGLGVHLVKEIASHYAYMRVNGCNQTQIVLELNPRED